MTASKSLQSLAILLSVNCTKARTWKDINIPAINTITETTDPLLGSFSQLAMEDTSFLYGLTNTEGDTQSTYSTPTPTISNEPSNHLFSSPTATIEMVQTNPGSNVPTWSPSARYQATNGNCDVGTTLHRLVMYNSTGDTLIIREAESSNVTFETKQEYDEPSNNSTIITSYTEYLCLKKTCYIADLTNITRGMSWELHQVVLGTGIGTISIAAGTSNESGCQFSTGQRSCITSCTGKFK